MISHSPFLLVRDLFAGFRIDFAGFGVDEILREIAADQFPSVMPQRLETLFGELARRAHGELLACLEHDLAGVGVDEVLDRLIAAQAVGIERHAPAFFGALVRDLLVEGVEDLLADMPSA